MGKSLNTRETKYNYAFAPWASWEFSASLISVSISPPTVLFFFLLFWTGKLTEMLAKPFAMDRSCPEYWPGHSVSKGPLAQCCTGTGGSGTWRYTQAPLECFGSWFGSSSSCKLAKECEMSQWVNCWLIWLAFGQEPDRLNILATQKYLDINLWYSTSLWDFNMLQCH